MRNAEVKYTATFFVLAHLLPLEVRVDFLWREEIWEGRKTSSASLAGPEEYEEVVGEYLRYVQTTSGDAILLDLEVEEVLDNEDPCYQ
jgi:hypothetical protein